MALPLGGGALGAGAQAQDEKSRTGTRRQMLAGSSGSVVDASKGQGHLNETAGPPVGGAVGGLDRTQGQMPVPGTCCLTCTLPYVRTFSFPLVPRGFMGLLVPWGPVGFLSPEELVGSSDPQVAHYNPIIISSLNTITQLWVLTVGVSPYTKLQNENGREEEEMEGHSVGG
jgi:hypothetical protein